MRWKILIVDDEQSIREAFHDVLSTDNKNYQIDLVANGEEAIVKMKDSLNGYDIVLTDELMAKVSGLEVVRWVKNNQPETDVVVITAHGDIEKAVTAMQEGATNFIQKPVDTPRLRQVVRDICLRRRLEIENRVLKGRIREYDQSMVVGSSSEIQTVYEKVDKVADTDAIVLIQGESGTGKEVIARALHHRSSRRKQPFIVVNCAALPSTLLENELFGHEREAFTGANSTRKGRFEQADTGTIFLDEITEMSLENQSRFLRVLEDGGFHRIGGSEFLTVNVRILAASNKDVVALCRQGRFREDLYYRLNVVPIHIPPLRERAGDVPVLAQAFLREFSVRYNREDLVFSKTTIDLLNRYSWPGNVRELRNAVERAVILSIAEVITPEAFPEIIHAGRSESIRVEPARYAGTDVPSDATRPAGVGIEAGMTLIEIERQLIEKTLKAVDGHRRRAAEMLGISVRALQYKIKDFNLK